jgi:hypothetical protein
MNLRARLITSFCLTSNLNPAEFNDM